jgi:hypothetical protein
VIARAVQARRAGVAVGRDVGELRVLRAGDERRGRGRAVGGRDERVRPVGERVDIDRRGPRGGRARVGHGVGRRAVERDRDVARRAGGLHVHGDRRERDRIDEHRAADRLGQRDRAGVAAAGVVAAAAVTAAAERARARGAARGDAQRSAVLIIMHAGVRPSRSRAQRVARRTSR